MLAYSTFSKRGSVDRRNEFLLSFFLFSSAIFIFENLGFQVACFGDLEDLKVSIIEKYIVSSNSISLLN